MSVCPQGGLCMMLLPAWLTGPMFFPGDLCPGGSLSKGSLSREVSVQGISVQGVSIQGACVQGVSVQGGLSGGVCQGEPPGQRPPCTMTRGPYASYWNAFLFVLFLPNISKTVANVRSVPGRHQPIAFTNPKLSQFLPKNPME